MEKPVIRIALQTDKPAIQELTTRAFGQEDEARIIRQLEGDVQDLRTVGFDHVDRVGNLQDRGSHHQSGMAAAYAG